TRAIETAREAGCFDKILVSTDTEAIADLAEAAGAEVPFLRPAELATDTSPVIDTVMHTLTYMKENEHFESDVTVLIQPTSPFTQSTDITAALEKIGSDTECCVSVCPISERPEWMFEIANGTLKQKFPSEIFQRSQDMPEVYRLN